MCLAALVVGPVGTIAVVAFLIRAMLVARSSRSSLARGLDAVVTRLARIPLALVSDYRCRDRWLAGVALNDETLPNFPLTPIGPLIVGKKNPVDPVEE